MLPGRLGQARRGQFHWALGGLSFELGAGRSLGIIGPNGAGKSTTLKLVAGVISATSGVVEVHGRTASLIELGAGFHPDMTGRENVYFSAAVLGMGPKTVRQRFDAIVEFAGVDEFLDTPVKRYSSGMMARLGFAVASHLDAEILVLDEVLAVGDAAFQRKCHERIRTLVAEGVSLLYVTHALWTVPLLCERAVLLVNGHAAASGEPHDVIKAYERLNESDAVTAVGREGIHVAALSLSESQIDPGGEVVVRLTLDLDKPYPDADVVIMLGDESRKVHGTVSSREAGVAFDRSGRLQLQCQLRSVALMPGSYVVWVAFVGDHRLPAIDAMRTINLDVAGEERPPRWGPLHLPAAWQVVDVESGPIVRP